MVNTESKLLSVHHWCTTYNYLGIGLLVYMQIINAVIRKITCSNVCAAKISSFLNDNSITLLTVTMWTQR